MRSMCAESWGREIAMTKARRVDWASRGDPRDCSSAVGGGRVGWEGAGIPSSRASPVTLALTLSGMGSPTGGFRAQ